MKVFWKQFFICKYLWNIQEGATASPFTIEKNAYSHIISIVTSRGEVICLTSVLKTQSCYCVENNCREVWQVRFPGSRVWAGDSEIVMREGWPHGSAFRDNPCGRWKGSKIGQRENWAALVPTRAQWPHEELWNWNCPLELFRIEMRVPGLHMGALSSRWMQAAPEGEAGLQARSFAQPRAVLWRAAAGESSFSLEREGCFTRASSPEGEVEQRA